MSRLCLDTSACSHFQRGSKAAVDLIRAAREIFVPSVAIAELMVGYALGSKPTENEAWLRQLLAQSVVSVLAVDQQAAEHYARLFVALRRAGTPLPTNDIWIAALAAREGATILTYDRHFEHVPGVGSTILTREPPG